MDIQTEARYIASLLRRIWGKDVPDHAVRASVESAMIADSSTRTAAIVVRPVFWAKLEAAVREELTRSA